jgi:hypothetical protein
MSNSIVIRSDFISQRLQYTLDFIFNQVLEVPYVLTTDTNAFAHINYGSQPYDDNINILKSSPILNDRYFSDVAPQIEKSTNNLSLFPVHKENFFSLDIFSAVFYCISGWERYFTKNCDIHTRFLPSSSAIYDSNYNFIYPWVDKWIFLLAKELKIRFNELPIQFEKIHKIQVTIDVDMAYSYLCKGFYRNLGGFFRDLLNLKFTNVADRLFTLVHLKKDVFDTFDLLFQLEHFLQNPLIYFFLVSEKTTKFDKNNSINCKKYQNIIQKISVSNNIGLHYSYFSKDNLDLITKEKNILENIINKPIHRGRAHYLRIDIPQMNLLADAGIKDDFSLGYASMPGFPLGTAHPVFFYDLKNDKKTDLSLHQTSIMDSTFVDYKKTNTDEFSRCFDDIRSSMILGGELVILLHNESFSNQGRWTNWSEFFINFLKTMR